MNKKRLEFYEEKAKKLGKILFIEKSTVAVNPKNLEELPTSKLIESNGHQYKARAVLKKVPVSRFTENANGRIYPKELDEKLIKDGFAEGTLSLADHPEDDGSITSICGVWHNPTMDDNFSYGDWYLVGEYGQLIKEAIEAGTTQLGLSRVGYGSLKEDGKTVDVESYELERWADSVLNPSQGVFATIEHISESIKTNILNESITNNKDNLEFNSNKIEEQKRNLQTMDKFQESAIASQVSAAIKEAKKAEDFESAVTELKEAKSYVPAELASLHTKLDEAIVFVSKKFDEKLSTTSASLKEKEVTLEELQAKYKTLDVAHTQLKEDYKKAIDLANSMKEKGDIEKCNVMVESLKRDRTSFEEDAKRFKEEIEVRDKDIATFEEEVDKRDKDISIFIKERTDMLSDISSYEKQVSKMKEAIKKLIKKVKEAEENDDFSDIGTMGDAEIIDETFPEEELDIIDVDLENPTDELANIDSTVEPIDSLDLDELDAEALINEAEDLVKDGDDKEKEMKEEDEKEKNGDDEDEKNDDKEEKKDDKKSESVKKVKTEVLKHYRESIVKYPALKDVKNEILSCKSLIESVKVIDKFLEAKKAKSEMFSLKEAGITLRKDSDLEDYKFTR